MDLKLNAKQVVLKFDVNHKKSEIADIPMVMFTAEKISAENISAGNKCLQDLFRRLYRNFIN